ncbi:TetR family transcriptional regulator [Saccharibacillus sp. CPCC 101409]|uniref:TetR family transcriptional regulator n=1 Tax=Saccharibacillus sp. CPCC 101409 TaxID=3058041 RepID=UPI002673884E|nr:TetR family transcriptional regulator [Saccharibacillus sp. CPCC 101409]MDO3412392.1 TetR family transcriptional regulator [Saccharibacillus sp. CPCC 101409]
MSPRLTDERKEQRNQQILEAAKRVFIQKGYSAASLKDIIEETGMSRGWIYLYYPTKEEIFEALLDHQDEGYEQYLEALKKSPSSIWEIVQTLYAGQRLELEHRSGGLMPAFYEYFLVGWRDTARGELLKERYEKGILYFADLLQVGVDRGEFTPSMDVRDISRLISAFQEGIFTHSITIGTETANTAMQFDAMQRYLHSLLHGKEDTK